MASPAEREAARARTRARLAVCKTCPRFVGRKPAERCQACGCMIRAKAQFATFDCPEGKWPVSQG